MNKQFCNLVIVDGYYFLYRNFFGFPGRYNSSGMNVNALDGFSYSIQRVKRDLENSHMVVVLDSSEPTFRHLLCPGYKADRSCPLELQPQLDCIEELLEAMDLPYIQKPGFEGDDLIGSLAVWFSSLSEDYSVTILSGDKDLCQLVNSQITVEDIFNRRYFSSVGVQSKFGVKPCQMIDYLTLVGDSADSVAGVDGIGEKTAASLLQQFDDLAGIMANLDKVKPKVANALLGSIQSIERDKQLVTIVTDLELDVCLVDLESQPICGEKVMAFKQRVFD